MIAGNFQKSAVSLDGAFFLCLNRNMDSPLTAGGKSPSDDVVYSSRDIIGESVAGKDKNFFVRLKKRKEPSSIVGKAKTPNPKRRTIIMAAIIAGVLVVGATIVLILLIAREEGPTYIEDDSSFGVANDEDEDRNQDEILSELNGLEPDSTENAEKIVSNIDDLFGVDDENILDIAKDIYKKKIDGAKTTDAQLILKINYADLLASENETVAAAEILGGISEDDLSPEQKVSLYAAYRHLYEITGDEETFNKYDALLDSATEELAPETVNAEVTNGQ